MMFIGGHGDSTDRACARTPLCGFRHCKSTLRSKTLTYSPTPSPPFPSRSCKPALALLKQVAEKGPRAAALQLGHEHFFRSEYAQALLYYLEAAEMGMELGQSNAAWLLHRAYISPGGWSAERVVMGVPVIGDVQGKHGCEHSGCCS